MNNQFHQTLNIINDPLRPGALEKLCDEKTRRGQNKIKHYSIVYNNWAEYLSEDLIESFKSIGLEPTYFIHFGSAYNKITTTVFHTDLYNYKGKYHKVPFSINWDLTQGTTKWHWYDTNDVPEVWPSYHTPEFTGIHYGKWDSTSVDGCTEIGNFSLERNTPYLVRTDVPHQIIYRCDDPVRMALSVRFDIDTVPSWEQALKVFEPLFL
jgi:hypothetical protein